jgi:hypothetical protein
MRYVGLKQGFDKLSPSGVGTRSFRVTPFALSLSKGGRVGMTTGKRERR